MQELRARNVHPTRWRGEIGDPHGTRALAAGETRDEGRQTLDRVERFNAAARRDHESAESSIINRHATVPARVYARDEPAGARVARDDPDRQEKKRTAYRTTRHVFAEAGIAPPAVSDATVPTMTLAMASMPPVAGHEVAVKFKSFLLPMSGG